MKQGEFVRLRRIEVDGLFGIYDHRIDLRERITILHGPNGVGKTTVLRMTDALCRRNIAYFARFPFKRFSLAFDDQTNLELTDVAPNKATKEPSAKLTLTDSEGNSHFANVNLNRSLADTIAEKYDFLRPYSGIENTWIDLRDDEVLTEAEVVSRFGGRELTGSGNEFPPFVDGFLQNANTHFIEVQRLVRTPLGFAYRRRRPSAMSKIMEYGQDLNRRMGDTMAEYGRKAQSLDQSFPQRIMEPTDQLEPGELQKIMTDLEKRMTDLDNKTASYKDIGILDVPSAHPFQTIDGMDPTRARIMTLYVQDTESKLQSLDDFAKRSKLLLESVNQKFRHKRICLDRDQGLIVKDDAGQPLPLDWLSSGEQHELVLHYDLLFRVQPNTVVLLDEPELSLHVEWQTKFLSDLEKIIGLSGFDAIMATHSPYIVGERDDLMVALGDQV